VPVPVFCYFCISEKLYRKYFRNWTKRKPNLLFFPTRRQSPKQRWRRAPRWPHHLVAQVHPWSRQAMVWAPRPPSDIALPPINSFRRENPKGTGLLPWKVPQRRRHWRPISGDRSLCSGTLPGRGIAPGAISIDSTAISIAVAISHDEEGVVLPRGWGLYRYLCVHLSPMVWSLCDHELCNLVELVDVTLHLLCYSSAFINVISGDTLSHDVKLTVCASCVALRLKFTVILIMSYYLSWISLWNCGVCLEPSSALKVTVWG
jgi:hypothetical protein